MKITDMKHGDVQAATQHLFAEITKQNGDAASDVINRIKSNGLYLAEIVAKMSKSGYQPNRAHVRAREIMKGNMFGIDDAIERFGVYPLKHQLDKLSEIRTSKGRLIDEKQLRRCKSTHILVAMFPVFPLIGKGVRQHPLFIDKDSNRLFHETMFRIDDSEIGWYLIQKTPEPETFYKEWIEQIQIIGTKNEIPNRHVLGYMIAGHFLTTGTWLFEGLLLRCKASSFETKGSRSVIGCIKGGNGGIRVGEMPDDAFTTYLAAATMLPQ